MSEAGAAARPHRVFVYGTLKRGASNHHHLAGQNYLGDATTVPGYTLYRLDGYPGLVATPADREGVRGEVWAVDDRTLQALDAFEGVEEGLYERVSLRLLPPFDDPRITAYVYRRSITGREPLGAEWHEPT